MPAESLKPEISARTAPAAPSAALHQEQAAGLALASASQAIFATRDAELLPEVIVREAMRVMSADAVSLLLPGVDGKLYIAHAYGLTPEVQKATRITIGEGIAGTVAKAGKPLVLNGDARAPQKSDGPKGHGRAQSSIIFPILGGADLVGLLTFNRRTQEQLYSETDLGIASMFAAQVLLALENVRFSRQTLNAEKLAAIGGLAAGIAHEMNTPLQFIGDNLEFLKQSWTDICQLLERCRQICADDPSRSEQLAEAAQEIDLEFVQEQLPKSLENIERGVSRVTETVQAIQSFGKAEQPEKSHVDINAALVSTIAICGNEFDKVARIERDFGNVPAALAYPGELNQVFLALLLNAAQAVRSTQTQTSELGTVTVTTREEGTQVLVTVRDTGPGIPLEVQARLFDPFFSTKGEGGGRGLGLSTARTIVVDRHGGSLHFETQPGEGTAFTVGIPIPWR